jgi:hypothetical protein
MLMKLGTKKDHIVRCHRHLFDTCILKIIQVTYLEMTRNDISFRMSVITSRWENLGIFSQSQPRIHFVRSQYNTFRGVNWKILRLSKVLLQFTEKGGNDFFDLDLDLDE